MAEVNAFFEAIMYNKVDEVMRHLDNGLPVDCSRNDDGTTGLMQAAVFGNVEVALKLLVRGANEDARDSFGQTALMFAVRGGHEEMARVLLAHNATVHLQSSSGKDALKHSQADGGQMVQILLDHGADVNAQNRLSGETALMYFTRGNLPEMVDCVLHYGADIDMRDWRGSTAVMKAAESDHLDILRKLLDRGANVWITDRNHESALSRALRAGNQTAADMIKEAGRPRSLMHYTRLAYNAGAPKPTTNAHWSTVDAPEKVIDFLKYEDDA